MRNLIILITILFCFSVSLPRVTAESIPDDSTRIGADMTLIPINKPSRPPRAGSRKSALKSTRAPYSEAFHEEETMIIETEQSASLSIEAIKKRVPRLKIGTIYDTLFHGFAVTGPKSEIDRLVARKGFNKIAPAVSYQAKLDESVPFIGAEKTYSLFDDKGNRLTGEGVKVGIIDTGIDYTHPDLRRNYGGGYDLIDGDSDPMETKGPKEQATLHGTHVAGIVAANGRMKGVAPDAEIIAYRALGPGGMGTSEQVIAAIEKAVEDGVDIINLSLGNTVNGPDWPTSLALNKAAEKGVVTVTSSGNSGPGRWTVGSPGTAHRAISVGASSPPLELPVLIAPLKDKQLEMIPLQNSRRWMLDRERKLIDGGIGRKQDIEAAEGKMVLIKRGVIPFTEKVKNAEKAGASAVLIYNNEKGNFSGGLESKSGIPAASITKKDGEWLKEQIDSGGISLATSFKKIKDTIAMFSSRGPVTSTWEIKPDVVAPGVDIDSTVPDGYEALQGTSMAAPHVAGAAALIKQAHPDWNPVQVKAALMNTAKQLTDEKGKTLSPHIQGAGRIQVDKAVAAETLIYPSSLTFGLFHKKERRLEKKMKLTIDNQSNKTQTYHFNLPKREEGLQWEMPFSFSLKPEETKTVTIELEIEPPAIKKGIHQGFLSVEGGGKTYSIPYLFSIEEPDYPRIMGFQYGFDPKEGSYMYEVYLPRGADELGIALFDPNTFHFIRLLDYKKEVERGIVKVKLDEEQLGKEGEYKALVFAKKAGKEDVFETNILVDHNPIKRR